MTFAKTRGVCGHSSRPLIPPLLFRSQGRGQNNSHVAEGAGGLLCRGPVTPIRLLPAMSYNSGRVGVAMSPAPILSPSGLLPQLQTDRGGRNPARV